MNQFMKNFRIVVLLSFVVVLVFFSCKKDDDMIVFLVNVDEILELGCIGVICDDVIVLCFDYIYYQGEEFCVEIVCICIDECVKYDIMVFFFIVEDNKVVICIFNICLSDDDFNYMVNCVIIEECDDICLVNDCWFE